MILARIFTKTLSFATCALLALPAFADDAADQQLAISHCSQCHTFGKDEPSGQGPNLYGIVGRQAGTAFGYLYSSGFMTVLKGKTWNRSLLNQWLTDTLVVAPKTTMVYFQDDPAKREAIIRYLASLH